MNTVPKSWYSDIERFLLRVAMPAQYTGGEVNMVDTDWSNASQTRFCMAFPDTYAIGMSNQGVKILYHLMNEEPDILCERAFAPWFDMEEQLREREIPLTSIEHHFALKSFDVIGFSLQNETSYTNLINMLDLGGIAIESADRTEDETIVVAGGTGSVTPEPLSDFVDLFFIGEGEEVLPSFLRIAGAWRGRMSDVELRERLTPFAGKDKRKDLYSKPPLGLRLEHLPEKISALSRRDFIALCAKVIPGCYAPSLYEVYYQESGEIAKVERLEEGVPARIKKNAVSNLNQTKYPVKQILPYIECVHDRVTIEVMRGCTEGCRYCQAGMIDRPQRYRTPETVLEMSKQIVAETGYDEVSLLSLSSSDHPQLFPIMDLLNKELGDDNISISLPSLRVNDQLEKLPEVTRNVRKSGLTMAPESGSARLRRVINKNISQEDLLKGAEMAFREGWRTIKFYFMIGLPTENDQDIIETAELLNQTAEIARQAGTRAKINVTISLFVPKAFTPFQWEPMATEADLEHRKALLKSLVQHRNIRLKFHGYGESWLESLFSRGDRRLGATIKRAWQLGARFDAWGEGFERSRWDQALQDTGLDADFYIHRQRSEDEYLPWDMLSVGVSKRVLWEERVRSRIEEFTPDCSGHTPGCLACGVDPLTCRTGLEAPEDEMDPKMHKRERVLYADEFKARTAQRKELAAIAESHGL